MKSRKRIAENDGGNAYKRHRNPQYSGEAKTNSSMDPNYGQRSAFGDFDCLTTVPTGDNDLDWEDDSDALAYLKSVRTQASTIPHVLVASKAGPQLPPKSVQGEDENLDRSIYEDGKGDYRGYYHDGAYTAYPPDYSGEDDDEDEDEDKDKDKEQYEEEDKCHDELNHNYEEGEEAENPEFDYEEICSDSDSEGRPHNSSSDEIRDAYFASLTNQFLSLRQTLQNAPPPDKRKSLPKSNPTVVGEFGSRSDTFPKWAGRIRGTDPLPAQIAAMHKDGVMRLLRIILGGKFLRKNHPLWERTSRWIWALLARLPERGELDYQEIGYIRELGKRAVLLMVSLAEMEVLKEHYDVGDSSVESLGDSDIDGQGIDEELGPDEFDGWDDVEEEVVTVSANAVPQARETDEAGEASDVEMQIDSDSEVEDGEVSEEPPTKAEESSADIETAKARLLHQLETTAEEDTAEPTASERETTDLMDEAFAALDADEEARKREERLRAQINERATLNMILTVAGEFYGQRDLLEFRDPFGGLQVE
ncbi:hypothetical protein F5B19DRAFT_458830 [Rostrohypoxylon terebratum]|nr:hypothetical protein F5B19DRAFT_458830 [Rostrohypoxylon terebratum]